jgi:MFS family permease
MQDSDVRGGKNWVLGVTALASFMMALDAQVITTAFATIRGDFGASVETLQWTVNAYNLTFAVLLLTGAALGDRFGRRRMFAAGIFLFALASAACALSGSVESLIAARSAQGAGAALVMPLAMAILSGAFAREERARALGIFSGVTGFALIIGPAIGGFITESVGWRWIFWINLPIGLIAIALVLARLRESFGPAAALDILGLVIVAAAALVLV